MSIKLTLAFLLSLPLFAQYTPPGGGGGGYNPLDYTLTQLADDFFPSGGGGQNEGQLGWNQLIQAGTGACDFISPSPTGHPGVVKCATSGASSDQTNFPMRNTGYQTYSVHLGGSSNDYATWEINTIIETDSVTTSQQIFAGFTDNISIIGYGMNNGIGVYYDTAAHSCSSGTSSATNLVFVVKAPAGDTCFDSGIAVAANTWYRIRIVSTTPGTVGFQVSTNGGAYSTLQNLSTNVPTAAMIPVFGVETRTAAVRNLYIDRWAFNGTGVSR